MFSESSIIDQIIVLPNNSIQVVTANLLLKDGIEISRSYSRYELSAGSSVEGQPAKVRAIAQAVWGS